MLTLTTKDRIVISAIFPKEADITTQRLIRELSERINLSEEEQKKIGLKAGVGPNGKPQTAWERDGLEPVKIELSLAEQQFLSARVEELNNQKKITQDMLDICLEIQKYNGKAE